MKRRDKVTGWFGAGMVTDVVQFDNLVRIMQLDKAGKRVYRYVSKKDCTLI